MISGAAVSNVVAVGIVTIPLMSRSGFSPTRAAAIESVGSTGGQLMPPVMGAAAFIMAEFLQVPYGAVVIAAIIPSVLYYAALFMHVDLEAAKQHIGAAKVEDAPKFTEVLKSGWHFPIPLIFLIVTIAYPEIFQIPIERSAVYATAHPDRAQHDLRLSRPAREPRGRCCGRSSTPAAPRSISS